jgi:hypothetical protein
VLDNQRVRERLVGQKHCFDEGEMVHAWAVVSEPNHESCFLLNIFIVIDVELNVES